MVKKTKKKKIAAKKAKKPAPKNRWPSFILPLGAGLVLAIVAFLSYFTLAHASLAPIHAGTLSIQSTSSQPALERQIAAAAKNYRVSVQYPDGSKKLFAPSETGVTIDPRGSAKSIKVYLHHHLWQRLAWWQPVELRLETKIDKEKLGRFMTNEATVVKTPIVNAGLSTSDGQAAITPESFGSGHTIQNPEQTIQDTVSSLSNRPLTLSAGRLTPAIFAGDLKSAKQKLTQLLAQNITFTIGRRIITAGPTDIAGWIELTPVPSAKTVDITVNSGKVVSYIDEIASPYVIEPRSRLTMNMPGGLIILDRGAAGRDVSNKDQVAAEIAQKLLKEGGAQVTLLVQRAEAKTVELPPYDKFIVIDTSAKRLYAYEKTNLVRTVLVSAGAPGTPTVLGQYKIYSKRVNQDMRGANVDGSRYFQADVPYVNYFSGSYAIHGNYWRPKEWFGNINSSHGCVGITDPDDAWIYNWAPVGTPVIVHD